MKINDILLKAINRYKDTLVKLGYCNNGEAEKVLVLSFISDLLKDDYSVFMTEDDYSTIMNTALCLSKNSCMIDYYEFAHHVKPIENYVLDTPIKVTEDNEIKLAEHNVLKLKNK